LSKVFKFGGASVKNAKAIINLKNIVFSYKESLIIIVSAIDKTTNELESVWRFFVKGNSSDAIKKANESIRFHKSIIEELGLNSDYEFLSFFKKLNQELLLFVSEESKKNDELSYSKIVSFGELFSTLIISTYLKKEGLKNEWIDARTLIKTSNQFLESKVNWEATNNEINRTIDQNITYVSQGFIGANQMGETTTLGREGSDFTAAIFAWCLDSKEVIIWKDVDGLLNADPKYFNNTKVLKSISFKEAIELSYLGASVIHQNTIKPLENKNIPLSIRSFINTNNSGSSVREIVESKEKITSLIYKPNQVLLSISTRDYSFIFEEHISEIFSIFSRTGLKVHLMQNSALSFSVCGIISNKNLLILVAELQKNYIVKYNDKVNLLTIRNFKNLDIPKSLKDQEILIQQRSRATIRYVLK
jgi:aspartate kinase